MITNRFRWLFAIGVVGALLGLLRGQELLALASLALVIWLLGEWLLFRLRFLAAARSISCRREVNGSDAATGTLWSGRAAEIRLELSTTIPWRSPLLRLTDHLAERAELVDGSPQRDAPVDRSAPVEIAYTLSPRGAGTLDFRGVVVQMFDLQGLFFAQSFVACRQQFRVLPMPVAADAPRSYVKYSSSLPPPGIHRLQKAGMGGELLDLREYVPGDPPKAIAWKVSARREWLMVRQHESEVPIRTTLFVDRSQGAQAGDFGGRPIDQLTLLAATIARSSLSVRDPVGLTLIDEQGFETVRHAGGQRHYFRLLDQLSKAAQRPALPPARLSEELLQRGWSAASDLYPQLMRPRVNRVPFFWFPVAPAARYRRRKRWRLAALFAELYGLPPTAPVKLLYDDVEFSHYLQRFLDDCGCAARHSTGSTPESHALKLESLTAALLAAVSRGRDNEVFVLLVDLLDHPQALGRLPHAIRVATGRHHRVIVICPWPDATGPSRPPLAGPSAMPLRADQMLYEGERLRLSAAAHSLARELRRCGASVAFAADPKVTRLVLAQADLVRTGRTAAV